VRGLIRKFYINILKNEDGMIVIWLLLFTPVILAIFIYGMNIIQAVTGADIDLQGAVNNAVKGASGQVTPDSQAAGMPSVHTISGHNAFRSVLADNLGLNPYTMTPKLGSLIAEKPNYVLIIYNCQDRFNANGAQKAVRFTFKDGVLSSDALIANGFPIDFAITHSNISLGFGGSVDVTLDKPGVIAVVNVKQKNIAGKKEIFINRWGSAKIVNINPN
jgi:hypothetical protein